MEYNPIAEIEKEGPTRGSKNDIQIDETFGRPRPSPTQMKPPSGSVKKIKKQTTPDIAIAIEQLDKIAQSAYEEKSYDQFGKYVTYELRQLPQRQAILLQSKI